MNDLLARAIAAHGGLDHWNSFKRLTVTIVTGGGMWPLKGLEQDPNPREETVTLHEETASVSPFGQPDWHTAFTPERIAIETTRGAVVRERLDPRASFAGHVMNTPWDPLQRAYFNGYAMWTYLTTPFLLAMPGFEVAEISPWQEGEELWRGLRARFPDAIASHSWALTRWGPCCIRRTGTCPPSWPSQDPTQTTSSRTRTRSRTPVPTMSMSRSAPSPIRCRSR